jgi:glutamate-1-semialdehyde aminotransferase/spore coat polysaccharide biosynthesis protein SpsF (cytidylyltransferase family)
MSNTVVVVQARMSSSRFPGKMLARLRDVPLIQFVCQRAALAKRVSEVIVATSDQPEDDPLERAVKAAGFRVHRGSLDDVLTRFAGAARLANADVVVRVTGDCPFVDPDLLDEMLARFEAGDFDYLSNVSPPTYPDGLDLEIMLASALERVVKMAAPGHQREHVTIFFRENPDKFKLGNVVNPAGDQSGYHWSVDRPEDLALVSEVLAATNVASPRLGDIMSAVSKNPDLEDKSKPSKNRNDGAIKSFLADIEAKHPRPKITKSDELWERASRVIPAGTQTLSKGPSQFVRGFAPKYLAKGKGSHVWDVDGNEYIDYPMGLGPISLGHGHPEVVAAVTRQMQEGTAFSLMHPLEVELAERITKMVPCAEMVRFGKNGSDATSACIRAARAKTGRKHIARCGYHGWQDWSIDRSYGIRARGVPDEVLDLTVPFPYNDLPALERLLTQHPCAAVILEPIAVTPPAPGYLEGVRALATKYGAVLVFDEVITGFRYARGGAQQHFGVTPDLASMGKGVANGLPLAIVVGKREFMAPFDEIFFSFTFGGETASLAAAMATLDVMEREDYWAHVWKQGAKLQDGYRSLAKEYGLAASTDCAGMPPWTVATFADTDGFTALQLKTLFQQEMIRHGILFSGSQFISLSHSDEDIARTLTAYREAMKVLRFALDCHGVDALTLGAPIEMVFRRA